VEQNTNRYVGVNVSEIILGQNGLQSLREISCLLKFTPKNLSRLSGMRDRGLKAVETRVLPKTVKIVNQKL
jgi:hypothetical protein